MNTIAIGILGCLFLLFLLFISQPVGFTLAIVGCVGFLAVMHNPSAAYHLMVTSTFDTFSKYDYTVIPLFVLMGQLAYHSGISKRLFQAAYDWLGFLPGGLNIATVGASAAFGAICGSGPATTATIAAVALPEMRARKYSLSLGGGAVAAGGGLGMLIPPSVVFIAYGIMTEQSPARLFIAGIVPGIFLALLFSLYIIYVCRRHPELGPAAPPVSWSRRFQSLSGVLETLVLFLLVIGGMFLGWFTPTEAAAVGAAGALAIAAFRKKLTWKILVRSLQETLRTSVMILVIIAGAMIFGRFLAVTGIPDGIAGTLTTLPLPGWCILTFILIFFIIMGMVVDALAMVLMTIPIFYPVILKLGYDPVWFGVMVVTVVQIGVLTPPVGLNAYVVSGMMRDVPLQKVFRGCIPFVGVLMVGAAIMTIFPQIALWLPNLMLGK